MITDACNVKLQLNKEYDGFTFWVAQKDVFIITDRTNKTTKLCKAILEKLELDTSPENIDEVYYRLHRGTIQLKKLPNGKEHYDIYGDNFGGNGYFVDEHRTIVISLDE